MTAEELVENITVQHPSKLQVIVQLVSIALGVIAILSWIFGGMTIMRDIQIVQDTQIDIIKSMGTLDSRMTAAEKELKSIEIRHAVQDAIDGRVAEAMRPAKDSAKKSNYPAP